MQSPAYPNKCQSHCDIWISKRLDEIKIYSGRWRCQWTKMGRLYNVFIYSFEVLLRFQHCTGHIMTVSWKGRRNQHIQFIRVLYCKLPTNGKQEPAFPLEAGRPQRGEARVLPLCHRGPRLYNVASTIILYRHTNQGKSSDYMPLQFPNAFKGDIPV